MRNQGVAAAAAALAIVSSLTACTGGSGDDAVTQEEVTIEWWHIQTQEPTRSVWQTAADNFEADHPGVTIEITVQNDPDFKTGVDARMQAGDPPDIFQTWGGGVLANQVDAGMVKDITADVEPWIGSLADAAVAAMQIDGTQYAVPFDAGLVGFWYNTEMFDAAGISEPPATWDEFLDAVEALKASGVTPIAVGAADKWPGMFYWAELALAAGGKEALDAAGETGAFDSEPFVAAGEHIRELVDLGAFQEGFLGSAYADATGSASLVANGLAAMELQGSWAPGTEASVASDGVGLGDKLAWFPFPTIEGGQGGADEGFGGVNAFAVGSDAPPEAVEFLEYLTSVEVQTQMGAGGQLLPVAEGAEDSVENPYQRAILDKFRELAAVQSYLDQAYAPAVATAINDTVQEIFAGTKSPEEAASAIAEVARR